MTCVVCGLRHRLTVCDGMHFCPFDLAWWEGLSDRPRLEGHVGRRRTDLLDMAPRMVGRRGQPAVPTWRVTL